MDVARQINVSLPPAAAAGTVDLEAIELLFDVRCIPIECVVSTDVSNSFNQHFTLQLRSIQGTEKLVQTKNPQCQRSQIVSVEKTSGSKDVLNLSENT